MHEVFYYPENFHAGLSGRKLPSKDGGRILSVAVARIRSVLGR